MHDKANCDDFHVVCLRCCLDARKVIVLAPYLFVGYFCGLPKKQDVLAPMLLFDLYGNGMLALMMFA